MSRPPRPVFRHPTTGRQDGRRDDLDFLPREYAAFLALQKELAFDELDLVPSDARTPAGAPGAAEAAAAGDPVLVPDDSTGDLSRTLFDLSALVAHSLGLYQDLYAREVYLGTARSAMSLVRHARRLAYEPDQGVSATGYLVIEVPDGLEGELPAGFAVASTPHGEIPAQDYETLAATRVDAAWNELMPLDATEPVGSFAFDAQGRASFRVEGTALAALEPGEIVVLETPGLRRALEVVASLETADGQTLLSVRGGGAANVPVLGDLRVFARPRRRFHSFAWNADSNRFPAASVRTAAGYTAPAETVANIPAAPVLGFLDDVATQVYLAEEVEDNLEGTWVAAETAGGLEPYKVSSQLLRPTTLLRGDVVGFDEPRFNADGTPRLETDGTVLTQQAARRIEDQVSGTTTALTLTDGTLGATAESRADVGFPVTFHADFELEARVLDRRPNPAPASQPLDVVGSLEGMRPGRRVVLATLDESVAQVVEIRRLEVAPDGSATRILWHPVEPADASFQLHDLKLLGNVVRAVHGKTTDEVLGGSDGVTPFLRFPLKQVPLTRVPAADGGEPDLEVRVDDVAWERVGDFHHSGPEDRHYRLEIDQDGEVTVIFGDGLNGAVPPSGKKHIRATYRTGLGTEGNAEAGRVARVKKAHPFVDGVRNPTGVGGGAEPAEAEDVRRQATRYIRTFDRAVSVADHADLALLFPGVARAAASWSDRDGIRLVVSEADGGQLSARDELEAFLSARRDNEILLTLVPPEAVDLHLTVKVEHDPAFLPENVKTAVQDALFGDLEEAPGLFTFPAREFGQPAFLSEVYLAASEAAGVEFVTVSRFALSPAVLVRDVIRVQPNQWLRLEPEHCEVLMASGGGA